MNDWHLPDNADELSVAAGALDHFKKSTEGQSMPADALLSIASVFAMVKIARELERANELADARRRLPDEEEERLDLQWAAIGRLMDRVEALEKSRRPKGKGIPPQRDGD